MTARVLPDVEDLQDPAAVEVLQEAKRELTGRLPDVNEATIGRQIETENELDRLNARDAEREARRQAKQAEAVREPEALTTAQQPAADDDDIPPEHRGKSRAQLAREYRELHSQIGRNGSELGEYRRRAAMLEQLAQSLAAPVASEAPASAAAQRDSASDIDFFADPQAAIEKAVSAHPALQSLRVAATETFKRKTAEQFTKAHPDAEAVVADQAFRDWVNASRIRRELMLKAHREYDLDAADQIFSTWRALKGRTPGGNAIPEAQATTVASPAAEPTDAKPKIYRRRDIQKLMIEDPAKYEAMADELARAYAAGRVR